MSIAFNFGKNMKKRLYFAATTLLLLITETLIALFVHDNFIRPYIGDVLAVIAVYSAVRIIIPEKCRLLPLFVFIFAAAVEAVQYFNLIELFNVRNSFLRILLGSVFDFKDILCYAAGCVILGIYEIIRFKAKNK